MKSSALAEFVRLLRKEGVTEFSGVEPDLDLMCWNQPYPTVHLVLGPALPEAPKPVEAAPIRQVTREPLPPELAPFMTAELQADLTATLED